MKSSKIRFSICITVISAIVSHAHAWSVEGHQVTAIIAQGRLNADTRKAITKLLAPGSTKEPRLADFVVWADDIRAKETGQAVQKMAPHFFALPDAEAEYNKFKALTEFKGNKTWHFVNMPVSATKYAKVAGSDTDVVEAIAHCVQLLETSDNPFVRKWALIFLIHCVGDLHQPLHSVAGYFDLSDPKHPKFHDKKMPGDESDSGANSLHLVNEKTGEMTKTALHHFWDENLVSGIGKDPDAVAAKLSVPTINNAGDYHAWPAQWVAKSLAHAKEAYANLTFGEATKDENGHWQILTKLPGGQKKYAENMESVAGEQLARAGADMADLLNSIRWKQ